MNKNKCLPAMLALDCEITEGFGTDLIYQPKLDGIRATWCPLRQQLLSRNGKKITSLPHVVKAIEACGLADQALDGELYSADLTFQQISGLVRRQQAVELSAAIELHVFDIAAPVMRYLDRAQLLESKLLSQHGLQLVPSYGCEDPAAAQELYESFLAAGYEGIMFRPYSKDYEPGKSRCLFRQKPVDETEVLLMDFLGAGKCQGSFNGLSLQTSGGISFVIAGLSQDAKAEIAQTGEVGSAITIQHNGFTDRGVPRHARYKAVRWDIELTAFMQKKNMVEFELEDWA